jgi:hypothetical protein
MVVLSPAGLAPMWGEIQRDRPAYYPRARAGSDKKAEQGDEWLAEDGPCDGVTTEEFSEAGRNALDDARSLGTSAPLRMRSIPAVPQLLPHRRFGAGAAPALFACVVAVPTDARADPQAPRVAPAQAVGADGQNDVLRFLVETLEGEAQRLSIFRELGG